MADESQISQILNELFEATVRFLRAEARGDVPAVMYAIGRMQGLKEALGSLGIPAERLDAVALEASQYILVEAEHLKLATEPTKSRGATAQASARRKTTNAPKKSAVQSGDDAEPQDGNGRARRKAVHDKDSSN